MAYQKQTENILAGSVNVLPPVDGLPQQDSLRNLNFRADTVGTMRSRKGDSSLATFGGAAVTSVSRVERASPSRYVGAGGTLYRNGGSIKTGFGTNTPIAMASFQNYLWALTDQLQAKDDGTNLFEWQIPAPPASMTAAVVAVGGATMSGDYQYFLSWLCADGSESTVAAPTLATVTPGHGVTLSAFPTYTPPAGFASQVVSYNLYRGGGTQTSVVLIATFAVGTASYTDSVSDIAAQENGAVLLATNYDPPPAAWGCAGPYYDRLLVFGTAVNPNRLWWSEGLRPYAFPGSLDLSGNWVDVGEQGEWILAVTIKANSITIYKSKSIWRCFGDIGADSAVLEKVDAVYGLAGRNAVVNTGVLDFFLNSEGVFEWNGEAGQKVSPGLNPIFYGEFPDVPLNLVTPMDTTHSSLVAIGYRRGKVWVSIPLQGQSGTVVNNFTLVYDLQTKHWAEDSRGFTCFYDENQVGDFLAGQGTALLSVEDGIDDHGTPIAVDWVSQFSNQGSPEQEKIYNDLTIEINTGGSVFTVYAIFDNGATQIALGPVQCTTRQQFTFPYLSDVGLRGRNHAVRLTGTMETSPGPVSNPLSCFLYKATLHYIVQPRFSRTYDSDVTEVGLRDVKFCDFIEFDIDLRGNGTGAYTWTLYSDRPRPTTGTLQLVSRASATFNDSTILGRRTIRIPITECEGQLFRVTLTADANGAFLLYATRLRCRPIGVYIDGANAESFKTKEIGLGI